MGVGEERREEKRKSKGCVSEVSMDSGLRGSSQRDSTEGNGRVLGCHCMNRVIGSMNGRNGVDNLRKPGVGKGKWGRSSCGTYLACLPHSHPGPKVR